MWGFRSLSTSASRTGLPRVESGRNGRFYVLGLAVLAVLLGSSVWAAGLDTEQRIERIRNVLLPPVLVKGESAQLTGLFARMEARLCPETGGRLPM
jgi:hypothetical protein